MLKNSPSARRVFLPVRSSLRTNRYRDYVCSIIFWTMFAFYTPRSSVCAMCALSVCRSYWVVAILELSSFVGKLKNSPRLWPVPLNMTSSSESHALIPTVESHCSIEFAIVHGRRCVSICGDAPCWRRLFVCVFGCENVPFERVHIQFYGCLAMAHCRCYSVFDERNGRATATIRTRTHTEARIFLNSKRIQ